MGRGLTQSQLFQTKTATTKKGDFIGILLQYGEGSPVPTKISPKITNSQKNGTFHEKIICLEWPKMQNKHYFFLFWNPNVLGGGQGSSRLGQNNNFDKKLVLKAPLKDPSQINYIWVKCRKLTQRWVNENMWVRRKNTQSALMIVS